MMSDADRTYCLHTHTHTHTHTQTYADRETLKVLGPNILYIGGCGSYASLEIQEILLLLPGIAFTGVIKFQLHQFQLLLQRQKKR